MFSVYKKELKSYFITPVGYIFTGAFLAVSGILFSLCTLYQAEGSSVSLYFSLLFVVLAVLLPLLTMKLLSDERRTKTEQLLLTSPISLFGMICGKYFAALTLYGATLLVNSINFTLLYMYGEPNLAIIIADIVAIFFVGAAFLAVGIFISALTESQLISAVMTMLATFSMILLSYIASVVSTEWIRVIIKWFAVYNRFSAFSNGMFDIGAIIYFISFTVAFLFLTARLYERRRWS